MTNEWTLASQQLPKESEKVLIMLNDASGYNAIFKNGNFVSEKEPSKRWLPNEVKFWKSRTGLENYNQQVKKNCGMCGRFR